MKTRKKTFNILRRHFAVDEMLGLVNPIFKTIIKRHYVLGQCLFAQHPCTFSMHSMPCFLETAIAIENSWSLVLLVAYTQLRPYSSNFLF